MSTLTVQNIQGSASSSNTINVASGHKISGASGAIAVPGSVVQIITNQSTDHSVTATYYASTSTTLSDVPIWIATITPKYANSKIRINAHGAGLIRGVGNSVKLRVLRDSTAIVDCSRFQYTEGGGGSGGTWGAWNASFTCFDEPNSTSAITYKVQMACHDVTNKQIRVGDYTGNTKSLTSFELMEIAQ